MTYVHRVTLDTAHVRRASLTDVPKQVRDLMTTVVRAAIEGGRHPVPDLAGFDLSIEAAGRASMAATLWRQGSAVVTFAVCRKSRAGPGAWAAIIPDDLKTALTATPPPPAPWLAVRLEAGAITTPPDEMLRLADVELAIAIAWLEMRDDE